MATRPVMSSPTTVHDLARAVAFAMGEHTVRTDVRNALRASPFVEHKVVLAEFLGSPDGQRLVTTAARSAGLSPAEFRQFAASLGELEFYVPRRNDRLRWTGTSNIVVAAMGASDRAPTVGFQPSGETATIHESAQSEVVFLIAHAEAKDLRVNPQAPTVGRVIQDSNDGEIGGAIMRFDAKGKLIEEVQLADIYRSNAYAQTQGTFGSMTLDAPVDTTFLRRFSTNASDGIGGMEIEFRSKFYDASNQLRESKTLRKTGVHQNQVYWWNDVLLFRRMRDTGYHSVSVNVVETDQFFNDDMGTRVFSWGDNEQDRTITGGGDDSDVRLGWVPKIVVNAQSFWATIDGAVNIKPNQQCRWTVSTNVISPQIEWRVGDAVISTATDAYFASSSNFLLEVQVWNSSNGGGANSEQAIAVSSSNYECNDQ